MLAPMKCHHYIKKHCLSCDLLSHDYPASISIKEQKLAQLFEDHLDKIKLSAMCDGKIEGTRNKAKLAVANIHGEIEFGFYDQHMHFKRLEDCPLHAPAINDALISLKKQLTTHQIIPYDLSKKNGELKYVLITYSESANDLLIRFVLRSKESLIRLKKLTIDLMADNSIIKVVTANIQPTHQAILEGDEEIVLTEIDYITHQFGEYALFQGPRSFFQTNSAMALKLYHHCQNELKALAIDSVLDLYCGVGAFSFFARKHCKRVTGIEISDAAIFYANQAREKNNHHDIQFTTMDVEIFLIQQESMRFDAMIVNPPRRGLNEVIIENILRLKPTHLLYSSCNAETLRRDLSQLESQYQINSLQLFDMFPFTNHFETLAVLSIKNTER